MLGIQDLLIIVLGIQDLLNWPNEPISVQLESRALLRRLCADHAFTVKDLPYEKELISSSYSGVSNSSAPNPPLAFIAEQLRLSDAQVIILPSCD